MPRKNGCCNKSANNGVPEYKVSPTVKALDSISWWSFLDPLCMTDSNRSFSSYACLYWSNPRLPLSAATGVGAAVIVSCVVLVPMKLGSKVCIVVCLLHLSWWSWLRFLWQLLGPESCGGGARSKQSQKIDKYQILYFMEIDLMIFVISLQKHFESLNLLSIHTSPVIRSIDLILVSSSKCATPKIQLS